MTREEKLRWVAEMHLAAADGKTLQHKDKCAGWFDQSLPPTMNSSPDYWRIKPEPKECKRAVGGSFDLRTIVLPSNWDIGTRVRVTEILEDE